MGVIFMLNEVNWSAFHVKLDIDLYEIYEGTEGRNRSVKAFVWGLFECHIEVKSIT